MIATKAHLMGVNENPHLYLKKKKKMKKKRASKEGIRDLQRREDEN